jgi:mono/diheme cytochrome c family protein
MMRRTIVQRRALALIGLLGLFGCGGGKAAPATGGASSAAPAGGVAASDLTPFELENGIGPIKEAVVVGPINHELAEHGKEVFESKCTACHKLDQRYVGPSLGGVTTRRTPTYIMNMVLNPTEMYERHPVAKDLLGQYMTQMPNLSLTPDQARQVMEYFRQVDAKSAGH